VSKDENDVRLTKEEIRKITGQKDVVAIDSIALESLYGLSIILYDIFKQQQ
jgi:hypothetical protein